MTKEDIVAACKKHYRLNFHDCAGFVRAVTKDLGYPLFGNADQIVEDFMTRWQKSDRAAAIELVKAGALIVAGLKSFDHNPPCSHGHVVIVVDGVLYHNKYSPAWCGSIGKAQSRGDKSVGEIWKRVDRDAVFYRQAPEQ